MRGDDLVWLTHPSSDVSEDIKVRRDAFGTHAASGWVMREDQSDPVEPTDEPVVDEVPPGAVTEHAVGADSFVVEKTDETTDPKSQQKKEKV